MIPGTPFEQQLRGRGWATAEQVRRFATGPVLSDSAQRARADLATLSPAEWIERWGNALVEGLAARDWAIEKLDAATKALVFGRQAVAAVFSSAEEFLAATGFRLEDGAPAAGPEAVAGYRLAVAVVEACLAYQTNVSQVLGTPAATSTPPRPAPGPGAAAIRASESLREMKATVPDTTPPEQRRRFEAAIDRLRAFVMGVRESNPEGGETDQGDVN